MHQSIVKWSSFLLTIFCLYSIPASTAFGTTSEEYRKLRQRMVREYIENPRVGDTIEDSSVLEAMRSVPRHKFVRPGLRNRAYQNTPLPIGHGQTISQPYIVAFMTTSLNLEPEDRVLEIGTGSGYQAAVLAEIVKKVYSIEIIPELAKTARERLKNLNYNNVTVKQGDGYYGWREHAPFDAIIVTAAPSHIPPPLMEQIKSGDRLLVPVGPPFHVQQLMLVKKTEDQSFQKQGLMPVRFVPFRRETD